jgi:3-hydroxyacyl-CoA dehydrogenase
MKIDEIGTVCFVGSGTMGCANSLVAAVSGYDVVLNDQRAESLESVAATHAGMAGYMVDTGYCSAADIEAGLGRVSVEADLSIATAEADLVSESVFENLELKRKVHAELDAVSPAATILTTNSSALLVSDIEDVVERGARFAALHSHLGALLYDIVGGPRTSPETVDILRRYVISLGGVPMVLKKENPGYVFNAMNGPVMAMALRLMLDRHASMQEIDRAWMSDRGAPMGPFGMMDLFGLDLMLDSWRHPSTSAHREALREKVLAVLTRHVEDGRLGLKAGRGFYDYPNAEFQDPAFASSVAESALASGALLSALVCSALTLSAKGVADPDQVDLAWTVATGQSAGPFRVLEELGSGAFIEILDEQVGAGLLPTEARRAAQAYLHA